MIMLKESLATERGDVRRSGLGIKPRRTVNRRLLIMTIGVLVVGAFGVMLEAGAPGLAVSRFRNAPEKHDTIRSDAKRAQVEQKHRLPRGSVVPVPHWVALGVLHLTRQLGRDKSALKARQSALVIAQNREAQNQRIIGQLKGEFLGLQSQNMRLKVQIQQRSMQPSYSTRPASSQMPPHARSTDSIVALRGKPVPVQKGKSMHPVPQNWMAIAVHGGNAVIQTPAGQVVMVHVGSVVDGEKITAINTQNKSVHIGGRQWVYLPK